MPVLQYPLSIEYVEDWGRWDILREMVSNALDVTTDVHLAFYRDAELPAFIPPHVGSNIKLGDLVIANCGKPMPLSALIIGNSMKASRDSIGQFGEGFKMAMLVASRLGINVSIWSGGLYMYHIPGELFGQPTLSIEYQENQTYVDGTVVVLHDWDDVDYADRFLLQSDDRIAFTLEGTGNILNTTEPDFFVRGVWLSKAIAGNGAVYRFGYNLRDVEMNRDRKVATHWSINYAIGKLWRRCDDFELLVEFFRAIKNGAGEKDVHMRWETFEHPDVVKAAFIEVYGDDSVIKTNDNWEREALHRGANVVEIGENLAGALAQAVGSDEHYVYESAGRQMVYIDDEKRGKDGLSKSAKRRLAIARKMAAVIDPNISIHVYMVGEGKDADADPETKLIRLGVHLLQDGKKDALVRAVLHEVAHIKYHAADRTVEHLQAIEKVAAQVVLSLLEMP